MVIDGSNNLYVAYEDAGNSNKLTVQKWNSSAWAAVGSAGISTGTSLYNSIAIDGSNNLYVAYEDGGNSNKLTVQKWNSTAWAVVGSAGISATSAIYNSMVVDASGNLYVAYSSGQLYAKVYNKGNFYSLANGIEASTISNWNSSANGLGSSAIAFNSGDTYVVQSSHAVSNTGNINLGSGNLTINSSGSFTVSNAGILSVNGTVTNNGSLTVAPNGALVASSANVSGNVILQQSIIAQRGWRMFANPFTTTQTFASLSTTNNVTINTSAGPAGIADTRVFSNSGNAWADAGTSTAANTAYGLFIRGIKSDISGGGTGLTYAAGPTAFTYSVSGTLNGSSFTVPSANVSNFSLVGNPYAAPVNSQALTGGTAQSYYLYQIAVSGNGRTKAGTWSSVLTSDNTSPIPVLGVIALKTAGNYSVSTSDINTTNAAATGLFGIETPIPHVELLVEQNGSYQDKLFVRLDPTATANGTDKIDLEKFYNDNVNVYSITTADNNRLAVDARNVLNSIPLGISALAGDYNFKLANNNLPQGTTVFLKDKFLNTQTELKVGDTYPFTISSDALTMGEQRFELSFSSKTISTANDPAGSLTANVLGNITGGNLIALQITGATTPVTIAVKDMNGKALGTINASNGIQYINIGNAAKGMLLLQISDGKSSIIKKVMKL